MSLVRELFKRKKDEDQKAAQLKREALSRAAPLKKTGAAKTGAAKSSAAKSSAAKSSAAKSSAAKSATRAVKPYTARDPMTQIKTREESNEASNRLKDMIRARVSQMEKEIASGERENDARTQDAIKNLKRQLNKTAGLTPNAAEEGRAEIQAMIDRDPDNPSYQAYLRRYGAAGASIPVRGQKFDPEAYDAYTQEAMDVLQSVEAGREQRSGQGMTQSELSGDADRAKDIERINDLLSIDRAEALRNALADSDLSDAEVEEWAGQLDDIQSALNASRRVLADERAQAAEMEKIAGLENRLSELEKAREAGADPDYWPWQKYDMYLSRADGQAPTDEDRALAEAYMTAKDDLAGAESSVENRQNLQNVNAVPERFRNVSTPQNEIDKKAQAVSELEKQMEAAGLSAMSMDEGYLETNRANQELNAARLNYYNALIARTPASAWEAGVEAGRAVENELHDYLNPFTVLSRAGWGVFGETSADEIANKVRYLEESSAFSGNDDLDALRKTANLSSEDAREMERLSQMTDAEKETYYYILGTQGGESAQQYLDAMADTLTARLGEAYAQHVEGMPAAEAALGAFAGMNESMKNIRQAFNSESLEMDPYEVAWQFMREDLGNYGPQLPERLGGATLLQAAGDLSYNVGNMAPSIAANAVIPGSGAVATGLGAAGGAYGDALDEGYTPGQARAYAALVGTSEALLEKFLGVAAEGGGEALKPFAAKIMSNMKSAFARVATRGAGEAVSNMSEEYLQSILEGQFRNWALGEENAIDFTDPEAIYSGLMGFLTGASFGTISAAQSESARARAETTQDGGQVTRVEETAKDASPDAGDTQPAETAGDAAEFGALTDEDISTFLQNAAGRRAPEAEAALIKLKNGESLTPVELRAVEEAEGGAQLYEQIAGQPMQSPPAADAPLSPTGGPLEERTAQIGADERLMDMARTAADAQDAERAAPAQAQPLIDAARDEANELIPATEDSPIEDQAVKSGVLAAQIGADERLMDMARTAADAQDAERAAPAQAQKQILFEAADALEDQPAAEAMVSGYDGGADAGEYARAFTQIYQAARAGLDMDQIAGALDEDYTPTVISQTAAMRAYYLGQNQHRARTTAQVETAGITPQTETAGEYRPGVRLSVAQPDALSASERGQIELMDRIGRKYGVEIEVADSLRGGEANGIYDPSAGRIIVARDAEGGMIMAAAMHEMGHFIADWSPDEWVQLSDYVTNTLINQGVDVDARVAGIKAQYENAGVAYDGQIGMDELVCNALPAILSDSGNVTRLAGERPRLAAKMREFIVNLAGQIRKMITALKNAGRPEAEAAARDVENLEIIADLFSASLEGAGHNRAQAEAAAQSAAAGAARAGAADGRSTGETSAQSDGAKQVDADGLRYSLKDTQDAQVDHLMQEREIAAAVNAVEDLGRAVNAAAHLDTDRLKKLAASEAARLKRESKSTYDRATLEDNLLKLYTYLNQPDAKWRQAIRSASDIALGVINGSALKDSALFDEYAPLRARLRQTKIRLSGTQRAEVENQYGSYNDYRKANFGRINLVSQGGISLDSLWVDLSEAYPQLFDADTNDAAQPAALMDALESIRPQYINPYGMGETEAALDMALEIMGRYGTGAVRGIEAAAVKTARAQLDKRIDAARQTARKEYDARLRAVRAKNIEARQALARKVRRETRESERKKYEKKYLELARRQTAKLDEQRAKAEKARENQKLTLRRQKVRKRIEKSAGALARLLESGENQKAVPDFLRGTIVRALESIDLSPSTGRKTGKSENWKLRISALRDEVVRLDRAQDGEDASGRYADLYMTLDPDTVGALDAVVESMGKAGVNTLLDMDEQALESLSDALSAIRRGLETIGQTWANERYSRVEDLGRATMRDMSGKKTKKARAGIAAQLDNLLNIDQLDSFSFFGALGPAAQSVQKAIAHGQEQVFARVREMAEILDADPAMGKNRGKRAGEWKRKTHTVKLDSGQEIKISAAQAMELYNLMRRPQAAEHILTGGIRLEDIDAKGGRVRQPFTARITMEDAAKIADLLTAEQKAAAESMQRHLSGTVAGWGNEVSQKMYLYDKFKEKPYWPIRTDRDYGRTSDPAKMSAFNAIRNSGFTKALKPHAKNPVLIGDAYDTFSRHVGQMAAYNGLAMPIDDALKWLSYADMEIVEGESRYTGSVKQALRRAMGERAQQYIVNLIKDVNGLSTGSYGTELASGLAGNMKAAAVAGNLRVVVQQPTAIVRAAAMINPKYLLAAAAKKHDMAEMRAHSPIAWWKSMGGGVDIGTGKSMRKLLIGDGTTRENILEAAMKPAGMADDITWSHLWAAVKLEIDATRSDLEKGSGEYFEAVNRRFTDIVDQTQVVDTVLHRSQLMRSKDGLIKMATAFMSEPTKTYNMMRNAIVDMADKKPGAKRRLTVTTAAIVGSTALTAAVKGLYDALRYRKEEDDFVKLWQENMTKSLAEDLNPLGIVPFAKDLLALIEGQDVERTDMSGIASFVQAVTQTYTHFYGGGTKKTDYQVIANLIKEAGSLRGLPLKGIMNSVETFVNGLIAPGFTRGVSTSDEVYGRLLELTRLGDARAAAMRDGLKTQARTLDGKAYNEYGLAVKTEKEIDVGLAGAMLADETVAARIAQAYQARLDTDTRTLRAIRRGLMDELNVSGEIVDKAINLYANQAEAEQAQAEQAQPQDEKTDEPLKERLYDARDLGRAIMAAAQGGGGQTDVQDIKAELVADSEAADPEKSVKSMASSEIKPMYINAYDDGDTALCGRLAGVLIDNFGFEQEDMDGWVKSSLRERLYAAIDGGDMAEAERQIEKLKDDFGMEDTDLMSSLNSKYRDAYRSAYFGGREAEAEALISRLNALGLRNKSGQAGWNDSWLKKYWQKPDED